MLYLQLTLPLAQENLSAQTQEIFLVLNPLLTWMNNKVATSQPDLYNASVTSKMTADNSVIRQIPNRITRPNQAQDISVNVLYIYNF